MSIVIGEFEVVNEPEASTGKDESGNQKPSSTSSGVTAEAVAVVEQYLTERALRVWAD